MFHHQQTGEIYFQLSPRERYVWQRLGGPDAIREHLAPASLCAQCDDEAIQEPGAWFCPRCRKSLDNLGQLPTEAILDHSLLRPLQPQRLFELITT